MDKTEILEKLDFIHNEVVFYATAMAALNGGTTTGITETGESIATQLWGLRELIDEKMK